jgi:hemerythrin-like domain-containing protein
MRLIDDLVAEHELIDRVVGSLRTYVDLRVRGEGDPADGPRFVRFLRLYAGDFHHAREEHTLFVALQQHAGLPATGPVAMLRDDHARLASVLDRIEPLVGSALDHEADRDQLRRLAFEYSHAMWHHIDAENSVLFPESEARLKKNGVPELPSRQMTDAERAAKADGESLVARYAPMNDPEIIRGDGCVSCPGFGERCRGLEREWWNESEWEEFRDHLGGD